MLNNKLNTAGFGAPCSDRAAWATYAKIVVEVLFIIYKKYLR
jgi:hypothetical protein